MERKNRVAAGAKTGAYAYVDGSYKDGLYGYGGILTADGEAYELIGSGIDPDMASLRNIAGEIEGSMAAVNKAIDLGIPELTIYYDYVGIEKWATGEWKRNRPQTQAYHDFMQGAMRLIDIKFVKVKAHSGVRGNEIADRMAKTAVGIIM